MNPPADLRQNGPALAAWHADRARYYQDRSRSAFGLREAPAVVRAYADSARRHRLFAQACLLAVAPS